MRPRAWTPLLAVAVLSMGASGPARGSDLTVRQLGCLNGAVLAQGAQWGEAVACVTQCATRARAAGTPIADCYPPYDATGAPGGPRAVAGCITSSRAHVVATQRTKCAGSLCPSCFAPDCAADAPPRMARTAALVDSYVPIVFCDDAPSSDGLSAKEWRCMRVTGSRTGRLANVLVECYAKCARRALRGLFPLIGCRTPTTDPVTRACLDAAQAKAARAIDAACTDRPECYAPSMSAAFWAQSTRDVVDAYNPGSTCAGPRP